MIIGTALSVFDPHALLMSFGPGVLAGIAAVVFIESGVLFPFLPGDSLLVAAAILAPQLGVPAWGISAVAIVSAIAGDQVGYTLGRRFGRRLFTPHARVLRLSRLEEAEKFFAHYGPLALVLGRFVPIVRTYVPVAAGTVSLRYRRFAVWNALGAIAWVVVLTAIGIAVGGVAIIVNNIDALMIALVVVSVAPIAVSTIRRTMKSRSK